jgi:four helix bundle protein
MQPLSCMQDFQHLQIWQRSHALFIATVKLTRGFRRAGHSRLRSQLVRAAESMGDTIAEGCGAATKKEFARYLDMSIKSANETEGHFLSARDLLLISPNDWRKYSNETIEIRKMTYTYRKRLRESAA